MIKRPDTNAQRLKRHKRVRGKISVSYTHLDVYKRQLQYSCKHPKRVANP